MYPAGTILEKGYILYRHVGVCVGDGRILQNTPFRGEEIVAQSDFINGERISFRNPKPIDIFSFSRRVSEIERNPRSYNLISNNCEHTISRALYGSAHSPQVTTYATIVLCFAAAVVMGRARR